MYTVHFVGLNYFNACTPGGKEVLIPNGTSPSDDVPQHFASLFIEAEQLASDDWWPDYRLPRKISLEVKLGEIRTVDVIEFRIPKKAEVTFQCNEKTLTNRNLDLGLPNLQGLGFVLDAEPDTIANVPLPGGVLEVFRFGASALVRWLITDHDDPITVTARAGKEARSVTLLKSDEQLPAEVVFSNTVDLLTPAGPQAGNGNGDGMHGAGMHAVTHAAMDGSGNGNGGHSATEPGGMHGHGSAGHFVLYAKLDKDRDESKFASPKLPDPMLLTPLPFSHPYLAFLSSLEEVPDAPCIPSCC